MTLILGEVFGEVPFRKQKISFSLKQSSFVSQNM